MLLFSAKSILVFFILNKRLGNDRVWTSKHDQKEDSGKIGIGIG
jgi:hypothetical protein